LKIKTIILDDHVYQHNNNPPDLIKIDIERDPLLISDKKLPGFEKAGHTCPLFG
jgi:hypothetical protein